MALIYIVEDDENIREIETIALKNSNYMVCAFEKAKETPCSSYVVETIQVD